MKRFVEVFRSVLPALVVLAVIKIGMALYAPPRVDLAEVNRAISSSAPVLLEFHASWCSTCLVQRNVLNSIFKSPEFVGIKRFTLNFDTELELKKRFGVTSQSTLVLIKNGVPIRRIVGAVSTHKLRQFFGSDTMPSIVTTVK